MGGVGSADSYMVTFLQTKRGQQVGNTADLRIHLAVSIVVAAGGILGGTVLREIEVREGGLVTVLVDDVG